MSAANPAQIVQDAVLRHPELILTGNEADDKARAMHWRERTPGEQSWHLANIGLATLITNQMAVAALSGITESMEPLLGVAEALVDAVSGQNTLLEKQISLLERQNALMEKQNAMFERQARLLEAAVEPGDALPPEPGEAEPPRRARGGARKRVEPEVAVEK